MGVRPDSNEQLTQVLRRAQELGFLGERAIPEVIDHAWSYVEALEGVRGDVLDLGSGGGVPGLVIAASRPDLRLTLLDRRQKRTDFLELSVRRLRWSARVTVVCADAEDFLKSRPTQFDGVVARGFGPGEFTLAIASRATRTGGVVAISEPPEGTSDRWPEELLRRLGMRRLGRVGAVMTFEPIR